MSAKRKSPGLLAVLVALISSGAIAAPIARVQSGTLRGTDEAGSIAYKGIPYAAPPTGPLRWRPPQPPLAWSGVRNASDYGPDCLQAPFPPDAAPIRTTAAEDCLTLNIWRPNTSRKRLPVMVWIHGGGFVNGGSSPTVYSGAAFARSGIVLVSINYRLGRFGFFAFPALSREHPAEPKANYGLMDQIAALKWIRSNIAAFGGDPGNVTVFGESAGGMSINILLTSPAARHLFAKAIIESGGGRELGLGPARRLADDLPALPSAEAIGASFARQKGIEGTGPDALVRLRSLPANAIVSGLNMLTALVQSPPTFTGPVIDGRIVVATPGAVFAKRRQIRTPLIVGANDADLSLSFAATIGQALAPFGAAHFSEARAAYDPGGTGDVRAVNAKVGADLMMVEPARFVARSVASTGAPVYEYRFGYVAELARSGSMLGAPHASEIPYAFDTVGDAYGARLSSTDAAVARRMNAYWINFARTGNPNGPGLPVWPRYDAKPDDLLTFRADGSIKAGPDTLRNRLDFIAATRRIKP